MVNVYDTANQLAKELKEIPQYQQIISAKEKVEQNEESKALYEEYKKTQEEMHAKMMSGAMPSEEDQKALQASSEKISQNEEVNALLAAQQSFFTMVDDLQRVIFGGFQELF